MASTLRIAVWHNLPSGGGKRALHDQVRGLVDRGHYVEAWCPSTAAHSYMPLGLFCSEHVVPYEVRVPPSRGRWRRLTAPYHGVRAEAQAMEEHSRRCAEQISQGHFDILLAHACSFFSSPMIGKFHNGASVLYLQEPLRILHESFGHSDGPRPAWVGAPPAAPDRPALGWKHLDDIIDKKWRLNRFVREMAEVQSLRFRAQTEIANARAFRVILCNSLFSRESLLRSYGIEAHVCYLGIDGQSFRPSETKSPYVVGLGSITPPKRVDLAIRALATIEPSVRPALVWVGNVAAQQYLEQLLSLAEGLGVRFEPRVMLSQDELVATVGEAAVMIYTPCLEPFGYAPLEANACGTWVVATAEGGVRETIRDGQNGLLLTDTDPESLGRAILPYTSDLSMARQDGLRARSHVLEHWDLKGSLDRLEARLRSAALDNAEGRQAPRDPSPTGVPDAHVEALGHSAQREHRPHIGRAIDGATDPGGAPPRPSGNADL